MTNQLKNEKFVGALIYLLILQLEYFIKTMENSVDEFYRLRKAQIEQRADPSEQFALPGNLPFDKQEEVKVPVMNKEPSAI